MSFISQQLRRGTTGCAGLRHRVTGRQLFQLRHPLMNTRNQSVRHKKLRLALSLGILREREQKSGIPERGNGGAQKILRSVKT